MRKLSEAMAQFASLQGTANGRTGIGDPLQDMENFGSNPGNLRARLFVPECPAENPPLVVVLHGCTQTAAGYDAGSGWSRLAEKHGFVLLFPEQRRANNPNTCFNWFSPEDITRDRGEALSIRQMIAKISEERSIDPDRIFITGLSAGGAMATVMLATYPELFAGGAIIAGLPYGSASSIPQALDQMRNSSAAREVELAERIHRASPHRGPWPTLSVWHGSSDATVHPSNAEAIIAQWRALHGVDEVPTASHIVDGHARRVWRDADQREVIEDYRIAGMGHGTPLDTSDADACGSPGAYMLEAGICSTRRIAAFWGLTQPSKAAPRHQADAAPTRPASVVEEKPTLLPALRISRLTRTSALQQIDRGTIPQGVGKVIDDALRAAGLIK